MDTVEQVHGYFYKGYWNLSPEELYMVIFIDAFSQHLEVEASAVVAILAGQPWIPTRTKPGGTITGTSLVSIMSRRLLPNVRLPVGMQIITPVGKTLKTLEWRKSNKVGAIIGRYIPWIGWTAAIYYARKIIMDTGETFNRIVAPKDRIQWTYF